MKRKGVTLIEVLIASLIAVIGITGSFASLNVYKRLSIDSAYRKEAVTILKYVMESNNRSAPSILLDLASDYPLGDTSNYQTITSEAVNDKNKDYMVTYSAQYVKLGTNTDNQEPGIIELISQVDWIDASGNRINLSMTTRILQLIM